MSGLKSQITNRKLQMAGDGGYMLISLMLIFALMAVALLAVLPSMKQQVQRDREDELRHRGTMYMRAIQRFYKKVGRYPTSFEELEQSNHIRYLRKRYKDPMSWDSQAHKERDFKPLHMQDVMLNNGPMLGAPGGMPGAGGMPTGGLPNGGPQGMGGFGQAQQMGGGMQPLGGTQQQSPFQSQANNPGGCSNASNGQAGSGSDSSGSSNSNNPTAPPNSGPGSGQAGSGSDSSGSSPTNPTGSANSGPGNGPSGCGTSTPGPNGQVFGGGAIIGVASTNKKDKAIHEFNKKNHYTDWYFIYDPNSDRGGLLIGPWQPLTIQGGGIGQPIGAPGTGQQPGGGLGQGQGSFGQSGFGQSGGFGQSNPNPQNQQNPAGNPPEQPNQQ